MTLDLMVETIPSQITVPVHQYLDTVKYFFFVFTVSREFQISKRCLESPFSNSLTAADTLFEHSPPVTQG